MVSNLALGCFSSWLCPACLPHGQLAGLFFFVFRLWALLLESMDSAGSTPDSYKLELPCPGEPPDPPDDRVQDPLLPPGRCPLSQGWGPDELFKAVWKWVHNYGLTWQFSKPQHHRTAGPTWRGGSRGTAPSPLPRRWRRPSRTCATRTWMSSNNKTSQNLCPREYYALLNICNREMTKY